MIIVISQPCHSPTNVFAAEPLWIHGGSKVVAEMARKKIYSIPTLGYHLRELDNQYTYKADWLELNLNHTYEGMLKLFRQMHKAGIKFAVGTDSNAKDMPTINALYLEELNGLQTGGLNKMDVITAATLNAAEAMGLGNQTGSIEKGKWADVILLDSDPTTRLDSLVSPSLVIQNGGIVFEK